MTAQWHRAQKANCNSEIGLPSYYNDSNLHPALAPETPLDAAVRLGDAGDMTAEMLLKRWRPRDERKAQTVADHGEPARRQREALAVGAGDHLAISNCCAGQPGLR
jgi:hypothetical protein